MLSILEIWMNFKLCKSNVFFNQGLDDIEIKKNKEFIDRYIPKELLDILKDSNGQEANSEPLFSEFENNILGVIFYHYNFLSLDKIMETYEELCSFSKENNGEVNLIPFAKINQSIGNNGSIAFTINKDDNKIYKTKFYEWEKFVTHFEFRSELFANNLIEFLENQILWYNLK